jgi:phage anti-repressor protein
MYLNYDALNDFIIDLDDVYKWLQFSSKENALRTLKNNFIENEHYKFVDADEKKEGRGGHNKKTILMTVNTFKSMCFIASTSKAKEIRMYYLKLEKIFHETINEQETQFKNEFNNLLLEKDTKILNCEKDKKLDRHNVLLKQFGTAGSLIYLIIVKTFEDGKYVLKIGSSDKGVKERYDDHKSKFDECLIIDCYLVKQSMNFEMFIHRHELIAPSKYKELKGSENQKELFLIGDKLTLAIVKDVIEKNIKMFDYYDPQLEVDKLKIQENILKLEIEKIKLLTANPLIAIPPINNEHIEKLIDKTDGLEKTNNELKEQITKIQTKTTTGFNQVNKTIGSKLQKINPETMQLVKVYDSIAECIKENPKLKRSSIAKAITNNTIYQGFRYVFVDRNLDSNVLHNVQPTKKTKTQNNGYIAKLSADKNTILNVYLDRKSACKENGHTSDSALDNPVKNCKISNGHYYMLYDSCSDELKKEFVKKNNNKETLYIYSRCGTI